jgi:hypothetical protein
MLSASGNFATADFAPRISTMPQSISTPGPATANGRAAWMHLEMRRNWRHALPSFLRSESDDGFEGESGLRILPDLFGICRVKLMICFRISRAI